MIKAGDLVMVVRGMICCGRPTGAEGMVFVVTGFNPDRLYACNACRAVLDSSSAYGCPERHSIDLDRLIRLDPPAIPETTEEEMTA